MNADKEEQIRLKVQEKQERMLGYLTNENRTEKQIKKQFYYMAQNHEKYPFMDDTDLTLYRSSLRGIQFQNFLFFSLTAVATGVIYKVSGGFTPNEKRPWLRRLRHAAVIGFPSIIIPFMVTAFYPGENQRNIIDLSQKYKAKLLDPEFNKKFIEEQSERYRKQLSRK